MANTFKTKTFGGGSTSASTAMTIYTVPGSTTAIVLGLTLSNISSANLEVTVTLDNNDGDNVSIVTNAEIPAKASLEIMTGNKYAMETADVLKVTSNTNNSVDTTLSIMEIA
jgi:NifU-like protein involved in Fe-S cluster formation|tara:strand:- start:1062 stop:1397 length:336 start_codon:yes stop_codon:yes gene_type:complete